MIKAHYQHHISFFRRAHDHCAEKSRVLTDVEETELMLYGIDSYEVANLIGRGGLEVAAVDVKHLVKESTDMKSKPKALCLREFIGIFVLMNPSSARESEFELVPIPLNLV